MKENNIILELTFEFSLKVIELSRKLTDNKEYVLSRQLLRCGTSIGANVEEAIAAQSRRDFINKMSIASKEARETRYWLKLLSRSNILEINYGPYLNSIEQIIRILTKIVKTTQGIT